MPGTSVRLVSLTPSNTELVTFLGLTDQLVGVDDWSDWPPPVTELPTVGPDLQIDMDRVTELDPDLVLASRSVPGMEAVVEALEATDLDHVVLAPKHLDAVAEDAVQLARRLGVGPTGHRLARAMRAELDRIGELTAERPRVRVYWEWWPKPTITAGGPGWMSELIERAGGINVFAEQADESLEVDLERVRASQPEVICLCWQGALHQRQAQADLTQREGWAGLEAVAEGRVLGMPEALFGRPGPRLVEGLRQLAAHLHPELADALGEAWRWLPNGLASRLRPWLAAEA